MGTAGIRVDPDGLKGFAAGVRSDATGGFEPEALAVREALDRRMPFGVANAGVAVLAVKQRYVEALNIAVNNLKEYADAVAVVAAVAETVAVEFRGADARSAQNVARVNRMLSDAAGVVAARNIAAQHVDLGGHR